MLDHLSRAALPSGPRMARPPSSPSLLPQAMLSLGPSLLVLEPASEGPSSASPSSTPSTSGAQGLASDWDACAHNPTHQAPRMAIPVIASAAGAGADAAGVGGGLPAAVGPPAVVAAALRLAVDVDSPAGRATTGPGGGQVSAQGPLPAPPWLQQEDASSPNPHGAPPRPQGTSSNACAATLAMRRSYGGSRHSKPPQDSTGCPGHSGMLMTEGGEQLRCCGCRAHIASLFLAIICRLPTTLFKPFLLFKPIPRPSL